MPAPPAHEALTPSACTAPPKLHAWRAQEFKETAKTKQLADKIKKPLQLALQRFLKLAEWTGQPFTTSKILINQQSRQ
jgi:hypothetical protein